jgi:hypothetical protein
MKTYEIICKGFDGSTDETDSKVIWVKTDWGLDDLSNLLKSTEAKVEVLQGKFFRGWDIGIDLSTNELTEILELVEERTND